MRRKAAMMAALASAVAAAVAIPAIAGATTTPARVDPTATAAPAYVPVVPLLGDRQAVQGAVASSARAARAATTAPAPITSPLLPSQCLSRWHFACYDATLLRRIYGLSPQDEGQGATVAVIMPYNDPVMRHDLDVYARQAGLGAPDLVIADYGHPVTADPKVPVQAAAVMEAELDVQAVYAMAPKARLLYVQTGTDFSLDPNKFASYYAGVLAWVATRWPGVDAVNLSLGFPEGNYAEENGDSTTAGNAVIHAQAQAINAVISRYHFTFTVATGDTGSAGVNLAGNAVYPTPSVLFPASDPMVLDASGTEVRADNAGRRVWPDEVWSDQGDFGATGGGVSQVFARPTYQQPYSTASGRGIGDIAMNAATESPTWVYWSRYDLFSNEALGWNYVAGTSESSPLVTGIVAVAAAKAGHSLGDVHHALYMMALHPAANGIQPVVDGCNGDYGVPGFCAGPGPWTAPDGTGTVGNGDLFTHKLALAA